MSNEVTKLLDAATAGDRQAAADVLPLVYQELRKLAAVRMAAESPGKSLQATALVHEAYLRLVGTGDGQRWDSRGHFFGAAAEAMRLILVDQARRRNSLKRGGGRSQVELEDVAFECPDVQEDLVALDTALDKLKQVDGTAVELIQLRYFAGLTVTQAAEILDISERTAERTWTYARAWLRLEMDSAASRE
jgi:RNA polymerase sigma factor (TIGR02999 family)